MKRKPKPLKVGDRVRFKNPPPEFVSLEIARQMLADLDQVVATFTAHWKAERARWLKYLTPTPYNKRHVKPTPHKKGTTQ